jgi:transposase-like protein
MMEGLDKETLKRLYIKERKATREIARIFGCSSSTIKDRCKKYGIKLRPSQKGKLKGLNKETVKRLYLKEQKSINKIAKLLDCSTSSILYRCKKYGINLRPKMKVIKGLNKSALYRLYVKEDKSLNKIAEIFSCSDGTIRNRCMRYGIELRRPKELNKALLQKLYVKEGRTVREIAGIIGCSRETVRTRCKKFGIKLRVRGGSRWRVKK